MSRLKALRSTVLHAFHWARAALCYEYRMVGVIDRSIEEAASAAEFPPVRWIEPMNETRFLASPFPWPGSVDTLLCRNFDLAAGKGRLAAVRLKAGEVQAEVDLDLPLSGDLAFPFTFMREGVVYLMPQSSDAGRLEIFRWQEQDGTWAPHAVVFEDKAVANAVLFEKEGWFWIAYTDLTHAPRANLNLVYASRLTGPWRAHPANPVRQGADVSLSGGVVFEVEGRLFRPVQDMARSGGGALRMMEIVTCTPLTYLEREVGIIRPSSRLYPDAVRALVPWGKKCLVEGMRLRFSFRQLWRTLVRLCRR